MQFVGRRTLSKGNKFRLRTIRVDRQAIVGTFAFVRHTEANQASDQIVPNVAGAANRTIATMLYSGASAVFAGHSVFVASGAVAFFANHFRCFRCRLSSARLVWRDKITVGFVSVGFSL